MPAKRPDHRSLIIVVTQPTIILIFTANIWIYKFICDCVTVWRCDGVFVAIRVHILYFVLFTELVDFRSYVVCDTLERTTWWVDGMMKPSAIARMANRQPFVETNKDMYIWDWPTTRSHALVHQNRQSWIVFNVKGHLHAYIYESFSLLLLHLNVQCYATKLEILFFEHWLGNTRFFLFSTSFHSIQSSFNRTHALHIRVHRQHTHTAHSCAQLAVTVSVRIIRFDSHPRWFESLTLPWTIYSCTDTHRVTR